MELPPVTVVALLELASLGKQNWEETLQQILRIDSGVVGVDRVGFWEFRDQPRSIFCELAYEASARAFERGLVLLADDAPQYFAVVNRGELIAADDAVTDSRTRELKDYLATFQINSMMDAPVWKQGHVVGVLCHEHVGAARQWTRSEQDFALATAQALTTALEARDRAIAEKERQRAHFLSEASRALSSTLDPQEVIDRAVQVALPLLGEGISIDLIEGETIRRVGFHHLDPKKQAAYADITRRFPPSLDHREFGTTAMLLKQSILQPVVTDDRIRQFSPRDEYADLVHVIAPATAIAVPLMARAGMLGNMVIVSSSRRYDQEALRLVEDFGQRVSDALVNARLYQDAQEAIRVRDNFLSLASHEFRTPLTTLLASAQALAKRTGSTADESVRHMSAAIARQAERLNRLVGRILDASRITSEELPLELEQVDLSKLCTDVVRDFAEPLESANCQLELDAPAAVVGHWDPLRLAEAVSQLLDNAIKFGAGKKIRVSVRGQNGTAHLKVRDHGIGIDPEAIREIFNRYRRAVSPRHFGGLGLGLYMVRKIAEAHGGTVHVESRVGEGAEFTIELPISR